MGFFFAALTALCFATSNIMIRKGMKPESKDNGMLMTVFINAIFLTIAWLIYRFFFVAIEITLIGLIVYIVAGVFTTFIGRVMLFQSIRQVGPSRGTAIKNSAPIFTILFAVMFLNESIKFLPFLGMLLVLSGLGIQGFYMVRHTSKASMENQLLRTGYLFGLASAIAFGVGQGVRKLGVEHLPDPFFGAFISATVALVLTLVMEGRKGDIVDRIKQQYQTINYYFVIAGVFTSIAVLSFFLAMMFIQVSYVSVIVALEPILTIILSKLILRKEEVIMPYTIVAACVVVAGAIMIVSFG
ncbi:DMT family transporter [Desulfuribacillus alkaliarsenatis]|uniref:EamA domain-containing protein n=1 Tax=Desulfuribacillus alkaliarsenatis TaxID=766136 RepID=A0A1E5G327_9FIRM|nr:DMT family transporter [Desulfuribacillus alkaliarsenatis]OEF97477.1 hypothetical protein BHF68_04525 [Desulfuribacillus alkaliarsenatis]